MLVRSDQDVLRELQLLIVLLRCPALTASEKREVRAALCGIAWATRGAAAPSAHLFGGDFQAWAAQRVPEPVRDAAKVSVTCDEGAHERCHVPGCACACHAPTVPV